MNAEDIFWGLAAEFQTSDPRVVEGTIMNSRCLRVGDEFLALFNYKGSGLVVKLPKERVSELVENGTGKQFGPGKKIFKEWLSVPEPDAECWRALLSEGIAFVASAG